MGNKLWFGFAMREVWKFVNAVICSFLCFKGDDTQVCTCFFQCSGLFMWLVLCYFQMGVMFSNNVRCEAHFREIRWELNGSFYRLFWGYNIFLTEQIMQPCVRLRGCENNFEQSRKGNCVSIFVTDFQAVRKRDECLTARWMYQLVLVCFYICLIQKIWNTCTKYASFNVIPQSATKDSFDYNGKTMTIFDRTKRETERELGRQCLSGTCLLFSFFECKIVLWLQWQKCIASSGSSINGFVHASVGITS